MKKAILLSAAIILIGSLALAQHYSGAFLETAVSVAASATATNGTDFDSAEVSIPADVNAALLTMTFTRAAGSSSLAVNYYFQVSYDNGTTFADLHDAVSDSECLSILTGHSVISGTTVRVSRTILTAGVTHLRLSKIVNSDSGNNLTAVNVVISFR